PREALDALPCGERLQPGLALAKSVQARFEDSNRDLTNARTDLEMTDLEPDWGRYSDPGNLEILDSPCAFSREFAALVRYFNGNVALARAQGKVTESEAYLARHRPMAARRCLDSARRLLALLKRSGMSTERAERLESRAAAVEEALASRDGETPANVRRPAG